MNAQVVFDLPLEGPFDYIIPQELQARVVVGSRVKVSFGPRVQTGFVTGLIDTSAITRLKPLLTLVGDHPAFNPLDLDVARDFAAYNACSLGEALATILRSREGAPLSQRRERKPQLSLQRCVPSDYAARIRSIIEGYGQDRSFLVLVPDIFRGQMLALELKGMANIRIGARSLVFESDGRHEAVIMVDDEDDSYKQEQMPMYETRQVLLSRAKAYGFDVIFLGVAPSVELMAMVKEGAVQLTDGRTAPAIPARVVDLTNYKFVRGLISPPLQDALSAALKAGGKSILILNRRGAYRLTKCVDCGEILKCPHCDSSLIYSRVEGKFLCRHCTFNAPGDTVCPKCHKPSWRSQGIGVEQVQAELKKLFPLAKVESFERESKQRLGDFDVLVATRAVLRFQDSLKATLAAFIDFDAELNRMDMRAAFNAYSLNLHIGSMAKEGVLIQTRNIDHYVLQSLLRPKELDFYGQELELRKEFGFSPYKHWVKISWRGKLEKTTQEASRHVYNALAAAASGNMTVTPPLADMVGRKRGQFRFNVMVQADHVPEAVAMIKSTLTKIRRPSRVIVTMNVDP